MCAPTQPEPPINRAPYALNASETAVTKEVIKDPAKTAADKVGVPTTINAPVNTGLNYRM